MTDQLDTQLSDLTRYQGEETALWKQALDASSKSPAWWQRLGNRPIRNPAMAACLVLVVAVTLIALTVPRLSHVRAPSHLTGQIPRSMTPGFKVEVPGPAASQVARGFINPPEANGNVEVGKPYEFVRSLGAGFIDFHLADPSNNQVIVKSPAGESADRHVVRKATIELISPDVRGTFAKAAHLISDAQSEYVENSSLSGTGKETQATLTLRIAADRLGAVLTALRDLGTVKSEHSSGEDVTGQVVDLEARIRNEQKVEQELLQLLEKRTDAPLKDILELRSSLSNIRETIERLIGQRDRLSRLVSLSSILVTIRPPDQPAEKPKDEAKPSIASYFSTNVAASWRSGLEYLANTLAGAVALLIGGLVWWLLLALAVMALLRYRTRAIMRGA